MKTIRKLKMSKGQFDCAKENKTIKSEIFDACRLNVVLMIYDTKNENILWNTLL